MMAHVLTLDAPVPTERLLLRPLRPTDLDDMYAIQSRADVTRYLYWEPRSRDEVRLSLQERMTEDRLTKEGDCLSVGAQRRSDGRVLGYLNLWWRSVEHRQAEIGFVFNPDFHGRGYASEAAAALMDVAFRALSLHRIYGRTDGRNVGSAGLMRRLGMRQEAHFRQAEIFKGEWSDELVFAVLADEWRSRAQAEPGQ